MAVYKEYITNTKNILLGTEEIIRPSGLRWKNLLLLAFGQKKMFRNPLVALLHFHLFWFHNHQPEVLEIFLMEFWSGTAFSDQWANSTWLINGFEISDIGAGCLRCFLAGEICQLRRFMGRDLDGWPRSDANYI